MSNGDEGSAKPPPPPPKIGTIRNFADLPESVRGSISNGALLALDGAGVRDSSVEIGVLSDVLVHFDRLFRIMQAVKGGFDVQRRGRLTKVAGARRLVALPALAGSFAMPLRLDDPEGEMVVQDHQELEAVLDLLSETEGEQLAVRLSQLPERVGDELYWLLRTLATGDVSLAVEAVSNGTSGRTAYVAATLADTRSAWLAKEITSEVGVDSLRGKLFRIDTKRGRVAIDVSQDDDEGPVVAEASFLPAQFAELRDALNHEVELGVSVVEEKRRYERAARGRTMAVTSIRPLKPITTP